MTEEYNLNPDVHRLLDGEPVDGADDSARVDAERIRHAVQLYADGIQVPGREVDWAVMKVIRARRSGTWLRGLWRWIMQPRMVQMRPAVAALAVMAGISLGMVIQQATMGGGDELATTSETPVVLVRFELAAPNAGRVNVAGSFNEWNTSQHEMTRSRATGLWTLTVPLESGEHEYMFVMDGELWLPDPNAHAQVDDGFGTTNSVIVVGPRGVARS